MNFKLDYKKLGLAAKESQTSAEGYHVARLGFDEWEVAAKAVIEASGLEAKLRMAVETIEKNLKYIPSGSISSDGRTTIFREPRKQAEEVLAEIME